MFTARAATWGTRGGRLIVNGNDISTPNFVISTTRGAVNHLTPDHAPSVPVAGVYAEELFDYDGLVESVCEDRTRLPLRAEICLGAPRAPGSRTITNKPNTFDSLGIDTVQGSRLAPLSVIADFMADLRPDLFIVPYDNPAQSSNAKVGSNRMRKMEQRSIAWLERFVMKRLEIGSNSSELMLVARIPPELRDSEYFARIDKHCDAYCFSESEVKPREKSSDSIAETANAVQVVAGGDPRKLRLSDSKHTNWRDVLIDISRGADIVHVPLHEFSDAGEALVLNWKQTSPAKPTLNLRDAEYTRDMTTLGLTGHAMAYIHHLLEAEEMTAQVLLQQHNLQVIADLFDEVRESVDAGTFSSDADRFLANYAL